ncbi:MAG TPA: potassium channel family protein, partial [Methylomicrobium sp.]|nr:potassium channel family protein [Methylomicrobium sp.]
MHLIRQLKISIAALVVLIALGTAGYRYIEGWRLLDAFYMTIITIATVGYREVHELSDRGLVFTSVLIIFGVSVLWFTIGKFAQIMFEGQLESFIG